MLDIGWSELLVVGVIALLVVGPKELPTLLRTIGRYVGIARRHANEFRAQFDEAIRESEFQDLRKDLQDIRHGTMSSINDAEKSLSDKTRGIGDVWNEDVQPVKPKPDTTLPANESSAPEAAAAINGSANGAEVAQSSDAPQALPEAPSDAANERPMAADTEQSTRAQREAVP